MKSGLLGLAGVVAALLLAEGVVRLLPAERLGYVWVEGGFRNPPELARSTPLPRRNRLGFHDVEPYPKPAGATRVLLLGDSFVEGNSVDVEDTVGRRLAHHLAEGGGRWDVVAYGRTGWGQARELEALREHGAAAEPDLVLTLFLHLNDLVDDSPELRRARTAERFRRVAQGTLMPDFLTRPARFIWVPGSELNRLISHRLALAFPPDAPEDVPVEYGVYAVEPDDVWSAAWTLHESLLRETREVVRGLGAGYAVVSASTPHGVYGAAEGLERMRRAYPGMRGRAWDLDAPDRRMARFCAAEGIPFLALEPIFRKETATGAELHWKYDGHWNVAGNDLAARLMADFVRSLVSRSPSSRSSEGAQPPRPTRGRGEAAAEGS